MNIQRDYVCTEYFTNMISVKKEAIHMHELGTNSCSRFILEKLIVGQAIKKFIIYYGTQECIAVFKKNLPVVPILS
jgi:hypothetical protein